MVWNAIAKVGKKKQFANFKAIIFLKYGLGGEKSPFFHIFAELTT